MLEPQCHQTQLDISMKSLVLIFLFSLLMYGESVVETDVVESVSVIVGDSFTLHTDVTEIQSDSVIEWRFGEDLIARINSESNKNIVLVNPNRETLQLDDQTGDLKIRNVRITDFGVYKLEINGGRGISTRKFKVSVMNNLASDGVKLVSVLERDSVILPSGLTEIQREDQITWKFEGTLVAQINQTAGSFFTYDNVLNGRFVDRLQLNQQTGSLIITNVRPNTSGLYEVDITKSSSSYTTHKTFRVSIIDGGNKLSVMEGTSVTLESGVPSIHRDDVIMWRCEHEDSIIAKISNGIFTFNGTDGSLRDTLELDNKTGSLTIRNIRTKHAGLYHLDITGNRLTIFRRFNMSISPQCWSPWVLLAFFLAVVVGADIVIHFIHHLIKRRQEASQTLDNDVL